MKAVEKVLGRANERKRILDSISSRDIRTVVVYGHKLVGKTLMLQNLAYNWLEDTPHHAIYLDLEDSFNQQSATESQNEAIFHATLNQLAVSAVSKLQAANVDIGDVPVRGNDPKFWNDICSSLQDDQKLIIMLDSLRPKTSAVTTPSHPQPDSEIVHSFNLGDDDDEFAVSPSIGLRPAGFGANDDEQPPLTQEESGQSAPQDAAPVNAENQGDASLAAAEDNEQDGVDDVDYRQRFYEFLPQLLSCDHIKLVLAANVAEPASLSQYFPEHSHQVRGIQLKLLSREDAEIMLRAEEMEGLVNWNHQPALNRVWILANGHPAFISAISSTVADDVFQDIGDLDRARKIQVDMIDRSLDRALDKVSPVAHGYWSFLSKAEQAILTVIAYIPPGMASVDVLELALNDIELSRLVWGRKGTHLLDGIKLNQLNLPEILAKLQQLDLIEHVGKIYRIPIGLMREWILDTHELPEDYHRLIEKASASNTGGINGTFPGGLAKYGPGVPRPRTGSKLTLAVLVALLIGALISLPFILQAVGLGDFVSFIPGFGPPDQAESVTITEAAPPEASVNSVSDTPALVTDGSATANSQNDKTEIESSSEQESAPFSEGEATDASPSEESAASEQALLDVEAPLAETRPVEGSSALPQYTLSSFMKLNVEDMIWSVSMNADESAVAAGLESGVVFVQSIASGPELQKPLQLSGHDEEVLAVAFHPVDSSILASSSADGTIRLWDISSGESVNIIDEHSDEVGTLAFSPNGLILASGSADETIRLWDTKSGEPIATLGSENGWVLTVAFSPDGSQLASGGLDGTIHIWDTVGLTQLYTLDAHQDWVSAVSYSPHDGRLASASYDKSVYLWNTDERRGMPPTTSPKGSPTGTVNSVAFAPNSQHLIAGQQDGSLLVWNLNNPDETSLLSGHQDAVRSAVFSIQGNFIATGALDGFIRLWEVKLE